MFDAYCEHLGAHLGYGGRVQDDNIVCPFHGWQWNGEGRNVCIPYQDHPNKARRIRTWPVTEANESVFIWHDLEGRDPLYAVPDIKFVHRADEVPVFTRRDRSHRRWRAGLQCGHQPGFRLSACPASKRPPKRRRRGR